MYVYSETDNDNFWAVSRAFINDSENGAFMLYDLYVGWLVIHLTSHDRIDRNILDMHISLMIQHDIDVQSTMCWHFYGSRDFPFQAHKGCSCSRPTIPVH